MRFAARLGKRKPPGVETTCGRVRWTARRQGKVRVETIYSLSGEVPPVDDAGEADDFGLWPGALTVGSIRQACSIRKLSAGGAIVQVDGPVTPGERLDLELMTGEQLVGTIEWQ